MSAVNERFSFQLPFASKIKFAYTYYLFQIKCKNSNLLTYREGIHFREFLSLKYKYTIVILVDVEQIY